MTAGIVAFSGPRACGKSTIAEYLYSEYGYTRIAFADAVRIIARSVKPGSEHNRLFLAEIGQALRKCVPKFAILAVQHSLGNIQGPAVIEDIRFPSEVEFCQSIGAITIRFDIDRDTQIQRLKSRGDDIEKIETLIDCNDELQFGKNDNWDLRISAEGDFKNIAARIHKMNRGVANE